MKSNAKERTETAENSVSPINMKAQEKEKMYTANWDDSDCWIIFKLAYDSKSKEWRYKVWLCIEGHQDDTKAKEIVDALNNPPADMIISSLEGAFDVVYENDTVTWRRVKIGINEAFDSYTEILKATDETIAKLKL